jgi:hypothetical protein
MNDFFAEDRGSIQSHAGDTDLKSEEKWDSIAIKNMRLCHPPDGITSPKYKLLFFITKNFLQIEEWTSF